MKIIFLDIDGVLNSFQSGSPNSKPGWGALGSEIKKSAELIDKPKVKLLNGLIEKTGAKVVIHSSWRKAGGYYGWTPLEMQKILDMRGFKGQVIGETPKVFQVNGEQKHREYEIREWIDKWPHKIESIVILDDIPMRRLDDVGDMKHWSVRTDPMVGLTEDNAGVADIILEREFHICNRCDLVCGGAYATIHDTKTNELKEVFCTKCDKEDRVAKYKKDKLITSYLLIETALDFYRAYDAPEPDPVKMVLHPLYSLHESKERLNEEVKLFDEEVWHGGLARFVREAKLKGYDAKFGKNKFLSWTAIGRSCTQLEKPDGTYINLIQADEDPDSTFRKDMGLERSRMGIQGICATEEEALELMREARAAWKAGKIKLKKNTGVGMF